MQATVMYTVMPLNLDVSLTPRQMMAVSIITEKVAVMSALKGPKAMLVMNGGYSIPIPDSSNATYPLQPLRAMIF